MKGGRIAAMAACTAALIVPLVALSRAPFTPPGARDAVLRLSWRMTVSAREDCRPRTRAELDALPVHMRTPEVCEAEPATYALLTSLGAAPADTLPLLRGGVKGDRPLFVLEERRVPPGRHAVRVEVVRTTAAGAETLASLDTTLTLGAGAVGLVTMNAAGRLVVVSRERRSAAAPGAPRARSASREAVEAELVGRTGEPQHELGGE